MSQCPDPNGQELAGDQITDQMTAHDVMLTLTGHCPWCGETDPEELTEEQYFRKDREVRESAVDRLRVSFGEEPVYGTIETD